MSHKAAPGDHSKRTYRRGGFCDVFRAVRAHFRERDGEAGLAKANDSSNGRRMRNLRK